MANNEFFYIFANSKDSTSYFPNNDAVDFSLQLPETIHLKGVWTCSLRNIRCTTTPNTDLYVFCDAVEESYVRNTKLPILQMVHSEEDGNIVCHFDGSICMKVTRTELNTLRIYIKTFTQHKPSFISEPLTCTLHFQRLS